MARKAKGSSGPRGRSVEGNGCDIGWICTSGRCRRIGDRDLAPGLRGALGGRGSRHRRTLHLPRSPYSPEPTSDTVVVMAWENYVDPEIQKRFHDATGITVRGIAADSDQDMFTKLKAGGGDQYDIVFANAGFCPLYHKAGLTEPLDLTEIPAAKDLWPIFKTNTDFPYILAPNKTLLYPSMWASFGICWNIEKFQVPEPYSWKSLWDAPKGKVILQGAGDDFISLAGLALGVPRSEIYAMTGPTLKKAADYLRQLKPFQISASSDLVTADAIRTGKAVVGQATSLGLAYRINEKAGKHVADIKLPKEGALGWVDGPQLVKGAKNRDNAIKFIDFLMGNPSMQDWLWKSNVFGMASQTTSERIMKAGAALNAPVYECTRRQQAGARDHHGLPGAVGPSAGMGGGL